jgi:hypothetical protein
MTVIAFAPNDTTPQTYDDADEFQNRAGDWINELGGELFIFPGKAGFNARRTAVLRFLANADPKGVEAIGFFCHGWATGIQAGIKNPQIEWLAAALKRFPDLHTICLYCCSCAAGTRNGERSFAAKLRDATGLRVWAHATKGHTTRNPDVIVYEESYNGGYYPVPRGSSRWTAWVKALRAGLWMEFPNREPWKVMG